MDLQRTREKCIENSAFEAQRLRIKKETQGTWDQASPVGFALGSPQGWVSGMPVFKRPGWWSFPGGPAAGRQKVCMLTIRVFVSSRVRLIRYSPLAWRGEFLTVYHLGTQKHLWASARHPNTQGLVPCRWLALAFAPGNGLDTPTIALTAHHHAFFLSVAKVVW